MKPGPHILERLMAYRWWFDMGAIEATRAMERLRADIFDIPLDPHRIERRIDSTSVFGPGRLTGLALIRLVKADGILP
jgi:hypothetical protein